MNGLKEDRLKTFFPDGRGVILPIDHGTVIPVEGMEDPGALIEACNPFVDGYVVNMGVAKAFGSVLEGKGVCLRTDIYKPVGEGQTDFGSVLTFSVEDALEIGADGIMNMFYLHHANEMQMAREVTELVSQGLEAEMPLILESLPYGIGKAETYTPENIGFAVRMGAELGADVVKTAFPTGGTVDEFKKIVDACFVPVVVLGGAAMGDDEALLTMVSNAMEAGAVGIAVGRNVWQHANPAGMAKAMQAVVHEGASVESALKAVTD